MATSGVSRWWRSSARASWRRGRSALRGTGGRSTELGAEQSGGRAGAAMSGAAGGPGPAPKMAAGVSRMVAGAAAGAVAGAGRRARGHAGGRCTCGSPTGRRCRRRRGASAPTRPRRSSAATPPRARSAAIRCGGCSTAGTPTSTSCSATRRRPTGVFDTVVVTSNGRWCGAGRHRRLARPVARVHGPRGTARHRGHHLPVRRRSPPKCATLIAKEQAHVVGLQHTVSLTDVMNEFYSSDHDGFEDRDNMATSHALRAAAELLPGDAGAAGALDRRSEAGAGSRADGAAAGPARRRRRSPTGRPRWTPRGRPRRRGWLCGRCPLARPGPRRGRRCWPCWRCCCCAAGARRGRSAPAAAVEQHEHRPPAAAPVRRRRRCRRSCSRRRIRSTCRWCRRCPGRRCHPPGSGRRRSSRR